MRQATVAAMFAAAATALVAIGTPTHLGLAAASVASGGATAPKRAAASTGGAAAKRAKVGVKKHKCPHCPYACDKKNALDIHVIARHPSDPGAPKRFKCPEDGCIYETNWKVGLDHHVIARHPIDHEAPKRFQCPEEGCNFEANQKCDLDKHVRDRHPDDPHAPKRFVCGEVLCEFQTNHASNMRVHFKRMHSSEARVRHKKSETAFAKALDEAGISYKREHRVNFKCAGDIDGSYASIDFVIDHVAGVIFMTENDEGQHKYGSYSISCDAARMGKIIESLTIGGNTIPIFFLRFNPDAYRRGGVLQKISKTERRARAIEYIKNFTPEKGSGRMLYIKYLFYDEDEAGTPLVTLDDEYPRFMKECVVV